VDIANAVGARVGAEVAIGAGVGAHAASATSRTVANKN
jgi:hypothetical protein